jgi:hypothetical protein
MKLRREYVRTIISQLGGTENPQYEGQRRRIATTVVRTKHDSKVRNSNSRISIKSRKKEKGSQKRQERRGDQRVQETASMIGKFGGNVIFSIISIYRYKVFQVSYKLFARDGQANYF